MIQFGTIFGVFLFSFSGAFYLALRGEVRPDPLANDTVTVMNATNNSGAMFDSESTLFTSLDLYPFETQ